VAAVFSRVQSEFDWDDYVRGNFDVKNTSGDELRLCCFACGDTKFKLYVNPVKQKFNCFKCEFSSRKYDTFDFVSKAENIPRSKAISRLVREYAQTTPDDPMFFIRQQEEQELLASQASVPSPIKSISRLPKDAIPLTERTEESAKFWDYLISRGITEREIKAVRFHYIPKASSVLFDSKRKRRGDIGNRLLIPIYGGDNELVSWQARVIDPNYPGHDKYLAAPDSELAKTLWPYVRPAGKRAVLVEGILDSLSCRRVPELASYATFSKKISLEQMLRLKAWGVEEIVVFWDKKDAKNEILKAIPDLQMYFKRVYVSRMTNWPSEKDPGNMLAELHGADKIKEALEDLVDTYDSLEFCKWQLTWIV
jgi:DNA primase